VPERIVQLPGVGVPSYTTEATPAPARGEREALQVEIALQKLAKNRGMQLRGDGRLAELASFVGDNFDGSATPPLSSAVDAYSRRLGLVEPVPLYMIFGPGSDGGWTEPMESLLGGTPRSIAYNRYGVAVVARPGQRVAVVVLSASAVDIAPMPRHVHPGDALHLRGRMRPPFQRAHVEMTVPNGSVVHVGEMLGTTFDFAIPIAKAGTYRVELLADGPYGVEVLANFPIFVSIDEPTMVAVSAASYALAEPTDSDQVAARLLSLLNEARRTAGVPELAGHAGLTQVAAAHSRDMVESNFFGHVSPTHGDPATRVHDAGFGFVLLAENIGRGSTADEVHAMLLDSPGHRANALDRNLSQVGIGVVVDRRGGRAHIIATEEFGGVSQPFDLATAPALVIEMINARRAGVGAPKLEPDGAHAGAAQRGATSFFADARRTQQQVVESVNTELARPTNRPSPIARRMRAAQSFLVVVVSLDRAAQIDEVLDPTARYIGVGVARGSRPETGPSAAGVVVVLGWPR